MVLCHWLNLLPYATELLCHCSSMSLCLATPRYRGCRGNCGFEDILVPSVPYDKVSACRHKTGQGARPGRSQGFVASNRIPNGYTVCGSKHGAMTKASAWSGLRIYRYTEYSVETTMSRCRYIVTINERLGAAGDSLPLTRLWQISINQSACSPKKG